MILRCRQIPKFSCRTTAGNAQHDDPGCTRHKAQRRRTPRSDPPQQNTHSAAKHDKTQRRKAQDPRTTNSDRTHHTTAPNRAKRNHPTPGGTTRSNKGQHGNQGHTTETRNQEPPGPTRRQQRTARPNSQHTNTTDNNTKHQPAPQGQESSARRVTTQAHQHSTAQAKHRNRNNPEHHGKARNNAK